MCVGGDHCIAGATPLKKGEETIVGSGAIIELLPGKQTYVIFFGKRVIESNNEQLGAVKRNLEHETIDSKNPKAKKSNSQFSIRKFFPSLNNPSTKPFICEWKTVDSLEIMTCGIQTPSSLIASFDLDGTITETKSGRLPFRTTPDDWRFWHSCVPKKLHTIRDAGYRVVVFTNQGGMNYGNPPLDEFKIKIQAVTESIGDVPMLLIAAMGDDNSRKPQIGMWEHFVAIENQGLEVELEQSYFIGDAAGRIANWKKGTIIILLVNLI